MAATPEVKMFTDSDFNQFVRSAQEFSTKLRKEELLPGVSPTDPWSEESLNASEGLLIQKYPGFADLPPEVHRRYEMYLGEGLVQVFQGSWVHLPSLPDDVDPEPGRGISYTTSDHIDVVSSMVPQAFALGAGRWWSGIFETTRSIISSQV